LLPKPPVQTGPTTEQVRELFGPDGSGTVLTDLQPRGGGSGSGGPPVAPTPEPSAPPPDGPQEPQGPSDPNVQRIEIVGRSANLPRDGAGNRYELAAEGYVVVHGPDGALTRIEAQQAQAWGLSAELAAAAARALPSGAVGTLIIRGAVFVGTVAPWTVAIGGLLSGDTEQPLIVKFGDDTQYVQQPGQTSGQLQTFDPKTGALIDQQVRHGYTDNMGRFMVLTDEQRRNLQQPTTTPGAPLPPRPTPPLPIDRPNTSTPGLEAAPPVAGTPGLGAAPTVTFDDLIMNSADSRALGNNLTGVGESKPGSGYQPHHIVPIDDPRAADLRAQLADAGITNLNQAVNGVWLPANSTVQGNGETSHNETFRDSYFRYLFDRLDGANTRADLEARLAQIKQELKDGAQDFPLK
jgi:hypothetical protein